MSERAITPFDRAHLCVRFDRNEIHNFVRLIIIIIINIVVVDVEGGGGGGEKRREASEALISYISVVAVEVERACARVGVETTMLP